MEGPILRTPEMVLRLAEILFGETQPGSRFEWFSPFKVEDDEGVWSVSGRVDPSRTLPPDAFDDQLENPIFHMHVVNVDAEVKDVGITVGMKLPPDLKAQIRAAIAAEGDELRKSREQRSREYLPDLSLCDVHYGGIINSTGAAIRFGELIFENQFSLRPEKVRKVRAEEVDGLWHVYGDLDGRRAELVFRRFNAQVLSLDLRPVE